MSPVNFVREPAYVAAALRELRGVDAFPVLVRRVTQLQAVVAENGSLWITLSAVGPAQRFDSEAVALALGWLVGKVPFEAIFADSANDWSAPSVEFVFAVVSEWLSLFGRPDVLPLEASKPVDAWDLFVRLGKLRAALMATSAWQLGRDADVRTWVAKLRQFGLADDVANALMRLGISPHADGFSMRVLREWLVLEVMREGARWALASDGEDAFPVTLVPVPATGFQLLWMTVAVTAAAVEPPAGVGSLRTCANERCKRPVFIGPTRKRFCSAECQHRTNARISAARRRRKGPSNEQAGS